MKLINENQFHLTELMSHMTIISANLIQIPLNDRFL